MQRPGSTKRNAPECLVASGTAAEVAPVQDHPVRGEREVKLGRCGPRVAACLRARVDAICPGDCQMRSERPLLQDPAVLDQRARHGCGELAQLRSPLAETEPKGPRPAGPRGGARA